LPRDASQEIRVCCAYDDAVTRPREGPLQKELVHRNRLSTVARGCDPETESLPGAPMAHVDEQYDASGRFMGLGNEWAEAFLISDEGVGCDRVEAYIPQVLGGDEIGLADVAEFEIGEDLKAEEVGLINDVLDAAEQVEGQQKMMIELDGAEAVCCALKNRQGPLKKNAGLRVGEV